LWEADLREDEKNQREAMEDLNRIATPGSQSGPEGDLAEKC